MSHAKNKIKWCLRKAKDELSRGDKHRGLLEIKPNMEKAREHIEKAEHNLNAVSKFKEIGFSDWSISAGFYCIYHCLLAICLKFGYESEKQECTFALIYNLIEDNKIDLKEELLNKVSSLDINEASEKTTVKMREQYQYGTEFNVKDDAYNEIFELAKEILSKTKEIIEE